jgi:hypothetical protein
VTEEELIEGCARAIHGANTGWNVILEDRAPDPSYDALPPADVVFLHRRVLLILDGYGPGAIHEDWMEEMTGRGWALGDVKDPAATPPTHPCLKDWRECPPEQQVKDTMAIGIVQNLVGAVRGQAFPDLLTGDLEEEKP